MGNSSKVSGCLTTGLAISDWGEATSGPPSSSPDVKMSPGGSACAGGRAAFCAYSISGMVPCTVVALDRGRGVLGGLSSLLKDLVFCSAFGRPAALPAPTSQEAIRCGVCICGTWKLVNLRKSIRIRHDGWVDEQAPLPLKTDPGPLKLACAASWADVHAQSL
jgi:hypothetical protein